jgi:hypothetical protein
MSIKLTLLKSGETIISDAKEMVSGEKVCGYIFTEPYLVLTQSPVLLMEEDNFNEERPVNITLTPWIILTNDKDILVPLDWVVTMVNPVSVLKEMYEERSDGKQNSEVSFTES